MPKLPSETGTVLYKKLAAKELVPKSLSSWERRAVVAVLFGPGAPMLVTPDGKRVPYTQEHAADLLMVTRRTIYTDLHMISKVVGHLVEKADLRLILGELAQKREVAQHAAKTLGNWSLYWQIEREFVESLQKLGIIATAPTNVNVQGKLSVRHGFTEFRPEQVETLLGIAANDRSAFGDTRISRTFPAPRDN